MDVGIVELSSEDLLGLWNVCEIGENVGGKYVVSETVVDSGA